MWMMKERERVKSFAGTWPTPVDKTAGGPLGLISLSNGQIISTVQYAFSTYVPQTGLEFNPGI